MYGDENEEYRPRIKHKSRECHQHFPGECGVGDKKSIPCKAKSFSKCHENPLNAGKDIKETSAYRARREQRVHNAEHNRQRR